MRYILLALVAFIIIAASISGNTFITKTKVDNVLPQLAKKGEPFAIFADMEKLVIDFTSPKRPVVARRPAPARQPTAIIPENSTPTPKIATPIPPSVTSPSPSTLSSAVPPPVSEVTPLVTPIVPVIPPIVIPVVPPVVPVIPPVLPPPPPPPPDPEPVPPPPPPPPPPPEPPVPVPPTPPPPPPPVLQTWMPPIGISKPSFGIDESYRMYDDSAKRNPALLYTQNSEGGYYTHYVDNSVTCTNTGNLYGTAANPRCTPVTTIPEGSVVEVHGGPYTTGSQLIMTFSCTEAKPCWFRGQSATQKPIIRRETIVKGSYVILEHLHYDNVTNAPLGLRAHNSSSLHHAAVRHSELARVSISGHSGFVFNNIVAYNNNIHMNNFTNLGINSPAFSPNDTHGVSVGDYSQYVWVIDNDIHNVAGDAVGNAHAANYTARDYYVGRNRLHDTGENAVDFKEIENVVISQNKMYNNYGPSSGSDGTALVLHYGPTYSPRNAWVIFNEIYDSLNNGIQIGGEVTDPVYIIGNIVHDIKNPQGTGQAFVSWGSRDLHLVGNVFYNNDNGINITGNGSISTLYLHNNIIGNNNSSGLHLDLDDSGYRNASDLKNNLFYQNGGQAKFGWGSVINLTQLKALGKCITCLEGDPMFVNPQANDFHLQASSPAIDKGMASALYDQYSAFYGPSITLDFRGTFRPQGTAWDIGAFEKF